MPNPRFPLHQALRGPRLASWARRDFDWALRMYRGARLPFFARILMAVSWLGDGIFWYVLIVVVAFDGTEGRDTAAHMVLAGAFNLALYRWLKRSVARPRPCTRCPDIQARARMLDPFSFPSGHMVHAVTFTIILLHSYPRAGIALLPVLGLIALSRMVLGLHYPSDVLAGTVIGATIGSAVVALF